MGHQSIIEQFTSQMSCEYTAPEKVGLYHVMPQQLKACITFNRQFFIEKRFVQMHFFDWVPTIDHSTSFAFYKIRPIELNLDRDRPMKGHAGPACLSTPY